ncbi:MAG: 30S ribosomal protein S4 [Candidatus Omnitrophica bacterium]|nr:30S ribosomal protein S4 [Candidatus Omnitrophota bacterium]
MGRRLEPACRQCRREGVKLYLKGIRCTGDKCAIERRSFAPGMHGRGQRTKLSDFGKQLREKQKMKKIYGVLERQFRTFFYRASKKTGVTGDILVELHERRLDNVVYRLLFVTSRKAGRQLVRYGHVLVNGKITTIPSYIVNQGDSISARPAERSQKLVKGTVEMLKDRPIPEWLALDRNSLEGKVLRFPTKREAGLPVEESQIVELYSK